MRSILVLLVFVLVCFGVAAWAGQFTPGAWYAGLEKPAWNPPGWVFAPVWTVLYALMAVAGWLVWREPEPGRPGTPTPEPREAREPRRPEPAGWERAGARAPERPVPPGRLTLRRFALGAFAVQLALNGAWSWLFFGLHRPGLALAEIVALWLAIVATTLLFWRVRPLAGALFLPYLAWVSFAVALNAALWRLNA